VSQIKQFAKRYLGKRAENFLQQVLLEESGTNTDKRELFQLISNPYFLTAFMIIYSSAPNEELPKNSGTLFEKLALALWAREEQRKSTNISFETAKSELARFAFAMIDSDMPVEVSREYALLFLRDKEILSFGQSASFLVSQNNGVRFYHQLIQEYFAAIGLARVGISHIRLDKKPLRTSSGYSSKYRSFLENVLEPFSNSEYRRSSKWDQVIISLCGFTEHPEDIIKKIARIDPLLAVDCLFSGVGVSLDDVIDGFTEAINDEDATLRKAALTALAKISKEEAIPHLAKALDDEDREINKLSANLLIQYGEPVIPYLINHLKAASDEKVILSIQALATLGEPAIPALGKMVFSESKIATKLRACNALGKIKHNDSNAILLSLLGSKEEQLVKICIEGLGNIGNPSSISAIVGFLNMIPKSNIDLRVAVARSLGNTRDSRAVPSLVNLIADESWMLHSTTLSSLKKIATPDALSHVKTFELLNARKSTARNNAIIKIQTNYGMIGLIHGLRSRSYWEIAHKLVEVPENDFEVLLKMSNSDSDHVKAMIAYCIGKRSDKKHERQLISLLNDDSPFVEGTAIDALGEIKSELAIPQLVKSLYNFRRVYSNSKERVCDKAAMALLKIGTKEATTSLKKWALIMINGRVADEQTAPLVVLKKVGDNEAVPRLGKILRSKKGWISNHARTALQGIGTPEALKMIEKFDAKSNKKNGL
jgi:HEAT repeat protein